MGLKAAGFASPAQGYEETAIDLNGLLVKNPPATFFFRLENGEMGELGLQKGALFVFARENLRKMPCKYLVFTEYRFVILGYCNLKKNVLLFISFWIVFRPLAKTEKYAIQILTEMVKALVRLNSGEKRKPWISRFRNSLTR